MQNYFSYIDNLISIHHFTAFILIQNKQKAKIFLILMMSSHVIKTVNMKYA